jgi:hypothetical protein
MPSAPLDASDLPSGENTIAVTPDSCAAMVATGLRVLVSQMDMLSSIAVASFVPSGEKATSINSSGDVV